MDNQRHPLDPQTVAGAAFGDALCSDRRSGNIKRTTLGRAGPVWAASILRNLSSFPPACPTAIIGFVESDLFAEMLNLARRLAIEAQAMATEAADRITITRKPDDSVVTEADHAVQRCIVEAINATFPDQAIVAEEARTTQGTRLDPARTRYTWVVDPLDGTRNYAVGFPCYATAIAVLENADPVVGVVHEHNTGRTYTAIRGRGAQLDGRPFRLTEPRDARDHLIGISSTKDAFTVRILRTWVPTKGLILRNLGSAAMHLALVAAGGLSAAFGVKCKIWDIAAGALLIAEAGGVLTDPTGKPLTPFDLSADPNRDLPYFAGSPRVHAMLLPTLRAQAD